MKKNNVFFVFIVMAVFIMFGSSCKEPDDCEGCGTPKFVEYTEAGTFYDAYMSYTGSKALIDTREKSEYEAGHLTGAVNFPADSYNTADDDAQWCKDILASYPTNTCLFFYGTTSFQMTKTVADRASRIGYGRANSRIFSKGYEALESVWK